MDERVALAVAKARGVLLAAAPELVEKTMWGSPAGKKRLAKRLAAMLPVHRAYTEPFAGSAAVLFAKDPVPTEAINDADPGDWRGVQDPPRPLGRRRREAARP